MGVWKYLLPEDIAGVNAAILANCRLLQIRPTCVVSRFLQHTSGFMCQYIASYILILPTILY